jgi:hypothetical protein
MNAYALLLSGLVVVATAACATQPGRTPTAVEETRTVDGDGATPDAERIHVQLRIDGMT